MKDYKYKMEEALHQVEQIRQTLRDLPPIPDSTNVYPTHRSSAVNLRNYVELRHKDLRELQVILSQLGLSSLGRSEAHVLETLDAVHFALLKMTDRKEVEELNQSPETEDSRKITEKNAMRLLGASSNSKRATRIMVTLPSEAGSDPQIIAEILDAGAEIIRINTAHDDRETWQNMAIIARAHEKKIRRKVMLAFDLAGPKLRIEEIRNCSGKSKSKIKVKIGDRLRVVNRAEQFAKESLAGEVLLADRAVFLAVSVGARVFIDDGAIASVVTHKEADSMEIEITHASPEGSKIALEKGVNLPDTILALGALSDDDIKNLDCILEYADIIELSFVRTKHDVKKLLALLRERSRLDVGIVIKIELVEAFKNLPQLLLALLEWERGGVMIARGDLAIEAGYLRLAEIQEEILWLCESAHIPVIWATEVLDQLSKSGHPSRAEVTDAAMSSRAECVMLNKGDYIAKSIEFLDSVLQDMSAHQNKKQSLLRRLNSWK